LPYLNVDDGMDEHPKVDCLSDAAYRLLMRDICAWSRTGVTENEMVRWLIAEKLVRRAPRHWLPDRLLSPLKRYRLKIPVEVRLAIHERDGWACLHCGATTDLTLDHIVPWSLGGSDDPDNLQTLCQPCNSRKGART